MYSERLTVVWARTASGCFLRNVHLGGIWKLLCLLKCLNLRVELGSVTLYTQGKWCCFESQTGFKTSKLDSKSIDNDTTSAQYDPGGFCLLLTVLLLFKNSVDTTSKFRWMRWADYVQSAVLYILEWQKSYKAVNVIPVVLCHSPL